MLCAEQLWGCRSIMHLQSLGGTISTEVITQMKKLPQMVPATSALFTQHSGPAAMRSSFRYSTCRYLFITISLSQTGTVAVKAVTAQLLCKYCGIQDCPFKQTSCFWIEIITAGLPYAIYPFPVVYSMTRNALTDFA